MITVKSLKKELDNIKSQAKLIYDENKDFKLPVKQTKNWNSALYFLDKIQQNGSAQKLINALENMPDDSESLDRELKAKQANVTLKDTKAQVAKLKKKLRFLRLASEKSMKAKIDFESLSTEIGNLSIPPKLKLPKKDAKKYSPIVSAYDEYAKKIHAAKELLDDANQSNQEKNDSFYESYTDSLKKLKEDIDNAKTILVSGCSGDNDESKLKGSIKSIIIRTYRDEINQLSKKVNKLKEKIKKEINDSNTHNLYDHFLDRVNGVISCNVQQINQYPLEVLATSIEGERQKHVELSQIYKEYSDYAKTHGNAVGELVELSGKLEVLKEYLQKDINDKNTNRQYDDYLGRVNGINPVDIQSLNHLPVEVLRNQIKAEEKKYADLNKITNEYSKYSKDHSSAVDELAKLSNNLAVLKEELYKEINAKNTHGQYSKFIDEINTINPVNVENINQCHLEVIDIQIEAEKEKYIKLSEISTYFGQEVEKVEKLKYEIKGLSSQVTTSKDNLETNIIKSPGWKSRYVGVINQLNGVLPSDVKCLDELNSKVLESQKEGENEKINQVNKLNSHFKRELKQWTFVDDLKEVDFENFEVELNKQEPNDLLSIIQKACEDDKGQAAIVALKFNELNDDVISQLKIGIDNLPGDGKEKISRKLKFRDFLKSNQCDFKYQDDEELCDF